MQLWREIQAQGYRHSARTVTRFITELRRASEAGRPPEVETSPYRRPQGPSARAVSFLVVSRPEKRSRLAQLYLEQLCQVEAEMAQLYELSLAFLSLVRERRGEDVKTWMAQAASSSIEPLARFATGLQDNLAAIEAGLTLPWSNGATEGHVTRLKLLKRQGYGPRPCGASPPAHDPSELTGVTSWMARVDGDESWPPDPGMFVRATSIDRRYEIRLASDLSVFGPNIKGSRSPSPKVRKSQEVVASFALLRVVTSCMIPEIARAVAGHAGLAAAGSRRDRASPNRTE